MNEILELLRGLPVGGISFAGIVSVCILMIFRGDIIPKSTLEKLQASSDAMIKMKTDENEMLKNAYSLSEQARELDAKNIPELLELGRTTVHLLNSIHDRAHGAEGT